MEFEILSQFLIFQYVDLIWSVSFKNNDFTLTSVAQLVGCHPTKQTGTWLCCGFGPQLGYIWESTLIDVDLPLFLSPFSSL